MINIILIVAVIVMAILTMWWAFNTVRHIQQQKEFAVFSLISIAKLWRKAKFVPEDAKDRESLYLYRDFIQKFDDQKCKYPIMVKNGGVRAMSRSEYDRACKQRVIKPYSWLLIILSVIYAGTAIAFNIANLAFGFGMSAIMPVLLLLLGLFLGKLNHDKNRYRDGLFLELKENSIDFLRITKPFILIDAYPKLFGKDRKPRYHTHGELKPEQIEDVKAFIIQQKASETKVVVKNVDNAAEIEELQNAKPIEPEPEPATPTEATAADKPAQPAPHPKGEFSKEERIAVLVKLVNDSFAAREAAANPQPETPAAQPAQPETPAVPETAPVPEPDPDDFSLDSIGIALDAEIEKRRNSKKPR